MAYPVVESSSPNSLSNGSETFVGGCSPVFSPSSDKRFWSTFGSRIESLLENRNPTDDPSLPNQINAGAMERAKRMKEDSILLLRGFDSVAHSLSQLSNNLENAIQGARDLAKPPTFTELLQCTLEKAKNEEQPTKKEDKDEETEEDNKEAKRRPKRKLYTQEFSDQDHGDDSQMGNVKSSKDIGKLSKAKNLAISMAIQAGALERELKSVKSDLYFVHERCSILEDENRRLRDGFAEGIRPEEDDLVRVQLEALLAQKSKLANENANLTRENRSLQQLVEYHQLTTQDISASYENIIKGMCLDFLSPIPIPEEEESNGNGSRNVVQTETPRPNILGFSKSLNECYDDEP